jgi:hypothetical protein
LLAGGSEREEAERAAGASPAHLAGPAPCHLPRRTPGTRKLTAFLLCVIRCTCV